ncbi:MAG: peptide deformylase [bacterium]|nr:peptide deformylase [bacterium]
MIVQKENKVLRENAGNVADIDTAEVKTVIKKMAEAMFKEPDGIGIAAPQIGESLRIFLVAGEVVSSTSEELRQKEKMDDQIYLTFINPVFKKVSAKKNKDVEGCLSVRGIYGEVTRPEKVTIEYFDEHGKKHSRGASGLFARVLQHEMDHLEGTLFIDKAKNIHKIKAEMP